MTHPEPERPGFSGRRKPSRAPLFVFALLLVTAAAAMGAYAMARPRLALTNRLAAPVRVTAGEGDSRTVAPGSSVQLGAPWGKTLVVAWEVVRPLSADGRPMGEELRGSLLVRHRWGSLARAIEARGAHGNYFAPLITNGSAELLRVAVNAGLEGAQDCGCAVRPDARRAFIGYYRLYQNSTVQATAPGRRMATFRELGPKVTSADGTVGLRFEARDLRPR